MRNLRNGDGMRVLSGILFCLLCAGCVPSAGLKLYNHSGQDFFLVLNHRDGTAVFSEKQHFPSQGSAEALLVQGETVSLSLTAADGREYCYRFTIWKSSWNYTEMELQLRPDMRLYPCDEQKVPGPENGGASIAPDGFHAMENDMFQTQ